MAVTTENLEQIARIATTRQFLPATARAAALPAIPGKIDAVIGMRRVGKTTLVLQHLAGKLAEGLDRSQLAYVNFEDDRLAGADLTDLTRLADAVLRVAPASSERERWYYLDEVQNVLGWERFVRRLHDTPAHRVVVTGSSAKLLSTEIATSLRGRSLTTEVYPFSFAESLDHHGVDRDRVPRDDVHQGVLEHAFDRYVEVGGFPEIQRLDAFQRDDVLQNYVDVVVLRDVVERHGLTNVPAVRAVVRQLLAVPGAPFSMNKVTADLRSRGLTVSRELVTALVDHFVDAFLVSSVPIESDSERKRATNPKKMYPADPALAAAMSYRAAGNGHRLEALVAVELRRRRYELTWVRTAAGHEIDFLARRRGEEVLVQVCWDLSDPSTRDRELRAIEQASRELGIERAIVVTRLDSERLSVGRCEVEVVPAWRWFLG